MGSPVTKNTTWLYVLGGNDGKTVKFGKSKDPQLRLRTLQAGNPEPMEIHLLFPELLMPEAVAHELLKEDRIHGEWYRMTDRVWRLIAILDDVNGRHEEAIEDARELGYSLEDAWCL